jgi:hypothetical protein
MARIRIDDLPITETVTPEEQEQILGAGRRSFRPSIEGLENREMYAANLGSALTPGLRALADAARGDALVRTLTPANEVQVGGLGATAASGGLGSAGLAGPSPALDEALWGGGGMGVRGDAHRATQFKEGVVQAASTGFMLNADGTVTVTTPDSYKVYQPAGAGWKVIASGRQMGNEWVEETWGVNGTRTRNAWTTRQHGQVGSKDHLSQIVIANGKATVTAYHAKGVPYFWKMIGPYTSNDATVTWVYSVGTDGNPKYGDLLEYHLMTHDGYYNNWLKEKVGIGGGDYYKDGWDTWIEDSGWRGVDVGTRVSWEVRSNWGPGETVDAPPNVPIQSQWKDGKWVETIWNKEHTQSITFVYSGQDKKELLAQTYGRLETGKWVETTTHSKDFITRTETYDKFGGTLLSRETTRTAADGRTATFHGSMQSGKWVETANDYLGYSSVTVEYDHPKGHPVKRYGQLTDGRYATDTFDSSGQHVVKREIFDKPGGKLLETWTVSWRDSGPELTISRDNPTGTIAHDVFTYRWVTNKDTKLSNYQLQSYDATFKEPMKIQFDKETTETDSTEYHWRTWTDDTGQTHYRESRQGGLDHNAPGRDRWRDWTDETWPYGNVYWNKS